MLEVSGTWNVICRNILSSDFSYALGFVVASRCKKNSSSNYAMIYQVGYLLYKLWLPSCCHNCVLIQKLCVCCINYSHQEKRQPLWCFSESPMSYVTCLKPRVLPVPSFAWLWVDIYYVYKIKKYIQNSKLLCQKKVLSSAIILFSTPVAIP